MINFVLREVEGYKQDYGSWRAQIGRKERGLSDLFNHRQTDERRGVVHDLKVLGAVAVAYVFLLFVTSFIPVGFDWNAYFGAKFLPPFWMPWTMPVLSFVSPQTLSSAAILGTALRIYQLRGSMWRFPLALLSLPMLWLLFKSDVDGLALIGLVTLPYGVPLLLLKPQLGAFALLANRRYFAAGVIWGGITVLIWGLWFTRLNLVGGPQWKIDWPQDISLFPWGLLLALPLLWLGRGDADMLMAAGSFATPHLFPYHFVLVMPAISRMSWPWAILCWAVSFLPLLANWWGPWAWHLGNLLGLCLWLGLYVTKRRVSLRSSLHSPTGQSAAT
jgi:hypothetical protein